MPYTRKTDRCYLRDEYEQAKELGFAATSAKAKAKNPYLRLADGNCLLWVAGGLIAIVTTEVHFGQKLYLSGWKSSNKNKPDATLTTTEFNKDGIGVHTEIYYREAYKATLESIAKDWCKPVADVVLDHINHMRGDCRRENLRPADKAQNAMNRSAIKIEKAFYTVEDFKEKIASGEWVPAED